MISFFDSEEAAAAAEERLEQMGDEIPESVRPATGQRVKPPRWDDLTVSGTPTPAWRPSISMTALLGIPNTWMLVVASTVSAYAGSGALGNDLHVKHHRVGMGWTWTTATSVPSSAAIGSGSTHALLSKVETPTLIMLGPDVGGSYFFGGSYGSSIQGTERRQLVDAIRGSETCVLGVGHVLHRDSPTEWATHFAAFVVKANP